MRGVEPFGVGGRVRVDLDHAASGRAASIDGLDAREILLGERSGRVPSRRDPLLEISDRRFLEFERRLWHRVLDWPAVPRSIAVSPGASRG